MPEAQLLGRLAAIEKQVGTSLFYDFLIVALREKVGQ
jgi:hypothetical protein